MNTVTLEMVIEQFREAVGNASLNYGMAYFPFLQGNRTLSV